MAASSSSSSAAAAKKYDVFVSFRGEDTRHSFTAHLYKALCRSSIEAYIDRELNKGDDISPSLLQAIEDSNGSLVIFSEHYASSKWCLNELLKILECRKLGHFVIPVFYNIDPSEVRKQNGSYGKAFAKHEQDSKNKAMVDKWKAALTEAANIAGWDSQSRNDRDESELIQNIVKDVLKRLDHIYEPSKLNLVGIDKLCDQIETLLQKFPVVGIWGIGGIGKTTIAKAVYDKLSSQYDSCCFVENIREESQRRGTKELRNNLLSELLKDSIISISPHKVAGLKHAVKRLCSKKVLIVLDDVDNSMQLEHLGQECKSLGPESRVIITTRDKHLLTSLRVKHEIYEVERLSIEESLELFRLNAFSEEYPEKGYEEITKKIVSHTQGTPLALKILGSFLLSKTKEEWESEWKKLKKIPNEEVVKVLKLSFDGLSYENQQIFLDIACFLKGENKENVISLLDSCGFYGASGIRTLQDRALITISYENSVHMHDLIQEMGREIIREESVQEPGRRSRLWDPEEVIDVLKYNKGTQKVESISLDMSQIKDLHLSADTFKEMVNLRYLNFYSLYFEKWDKIHAPVNTQLFSDKLRYLHWDNCPLQSLSSNFCAEKLVELKIPRSHMKRLWNGVQDLVNLKSLDLTGCEQLIELPDLSKASTLKSVQLARCRNLRHLHPSILSSRTLEILNVSWCGKLKSLQSEVRLKQCERLPYISEHPFISSLPTSELPTFPTSAEMVRLINCTSLETIMIPMSVEYKRSCYFLANCVKLDEHTLSSIMELTYFRIKQAAMGALCEDDSTHEGFGENHIFFPGNRVPSWFRYRAAKNWISIEIPPRSHLLGFAFCCILSPEVFPYQGKSLDRCECYCYLEDSQFSVFRTFSFDLSSGGFKVELISDHVCIWYYEWDCNNLFGDMEKQKATGQRSKKLSFEFYVVAANEMGNLIKKENVIKECGVWPIYASEYDISKNDLELRKGIKLGYRTDDIDEQVQLQFDQLRPSISATGFTSFVFDHRDQDISLQNARQDFPEINSLCQPNRFNELDYSSSQMELSLESGSGNKSKRKKDIDEFLGGVDTSEIGVGCSEFEQRPLPPTNKMNEKTSCGCFIDPQTNLLEGIEVGGSRQESQHEQEQLVTGNGIGRVHLPSNSYKNMDAEWYKA